MEQGKASVLNFKIWKGLKFFWKISKLGGPTCQCLHSGYVPLIFRPWLMRLQTPPVSGRRPISPTASTSPPYPLVEQLDKVKLISFSLVAAHAHSALMLLLYPPRHRSSGKQSSTRCRYASYLEQHVDEVSSPATSPVASRSPSTEMQYDIRFSEHLPTGNSLLFPSGKAATSSSSVRVL
jgi:hypothetical protein